MLLEGEINIKAPRETVYHYLTDAKMVSKCMPGVKSMEVITPDKKFRAVGAIGLGSIKVNVTNDIEWTELDPPNGAKIRVHGTATGSSMDTSSEMSLSDGPDGSTNMKWSAEIRVVGGAARRPAPPLRRTRPRSRPLSRRSS